MSIAKRLLAGALCTAAAACANPSANDPAEPANRVVFAGNKFVDDNALKPVAEAYQEHMPGRVQKSVHNFASNLGQPAVALNDVLQGNVSRSWNTIQRFAINSTVGGAGLFDVATEWDRPGHKSDFGQTLGVWALALARAFSCRCLALRTCATVSARSSISWRAPRISSAAPRRPSAWSAERRVPSTAGPAR